MQPATVICCFCGLALPEAMAVLIALFPASRRDESQALYAHGKCLRDRVKPEFPLHPDIEDSDVV